MSKAVFEVHAHHKNSPQKKIYPRTIFWAASLPDMKPSRACPKLILRSMPIISIAHKKDLSSKLNCLHKHSFFTTFDMPQHLGRKVILIGVSLTLEINFLVSTVCEDQVFFQKLCKYLTSAHSQFSGFRHPCIQSCNCTTHEDPVFTGQLTF